MKKTIIGAACIIGNSIITAGMVIAIRLSMYFGDSVPSAAPIKGWLPWAVLLIAGVVFTILGLKQKD